MEDCLCLNRQDEPRSQKDDGASSQNAVFVHVYDLDSYIAKVNAVTRHITQSGVFHVGVQVYSDEWSFGQHDDISSGVTCNRPKEHLFHVYRETVFQGDTDLSRAEVWLLLERLKPEWPGNSYHLLQRNCISFADALCIELGVKRIPEWIIRLPRQGAGLAEGIRSGIAGFKEGMSLLTFQEPAYEEEDDEEYDETMAGHRRDSLRAPLTYQDSARRTPAPAQIDRPLGINGINDRELIERMSRSSDFIPLTSNVLKGKKAGAKEGKEKQQQRSSGVRERPETAPSPAAVSTTASNASQLSTHRTITTMSRDKDRERYRELAKGIERHSLS